MLRGIIKIEGEKNVNLYYNWPNRLINHLYLYLI